MYRIGDLIHYGDTGVCTHVDAFYSREMRQLSDHYKKSLNSHLCEDLIELTMSIYAKKQELGEQNKKIGSLDESVMKRAEDLLFGELSAALEIPKEKVADYIAAKVDAIKAVKKAEVQA
ncbi:hypothetical protein DFP94_106181 [Fontibacillus phaseoli]|uniref:CarD family transcriptional regulator n=1 Tax=Fontibacillus phaseoli TaxID=1416533 RepID=A0A369BDV4_9BACL|nr:hypothetical protein [Fontibacillus phaseoli]RCX18647.1 hypothetical protein DFP94_106181 [Fontibacillus phaseoli]